MKRFNLLSILILFFTFFGVQCVVAAIDGSGPIQEGTTWYTTTAYSNNTTNNDCYTFGSNLDINLPYPSNFVFFEACANNGSVGTRTISIDQYKPNDKNEFNWISTGYTTPTLNNNSWNLGKAKQNWDAWTLYSTDKISTSATQIAFIDNGGSLSRYICKIKVRMAPHIKMSTNSLEFDFNKYGTTDTTKKDVIFHSFLTAGNLTYQVINKNDDNPNPYFKLYETKTVGNNTFSAIGDTTYNFKVTFNPVADKHGLYEARIKITDGVSTAYVNLSGYKHNQTISWEQNLTEMILYEDIELTAIASPDPQMPITYTWSPQDAFLCEGNRIVPIKVYDNATITANQYGHRYYNIADSVTKTVKIIEQKRNSITWKYNFSSIGISEEDRTYDLSNNTYGATALFGNITYQIESNPDGLIELNGNTLIVKGNKPGTAVVKAYVEGTDDYLGAETRKTIVANDGIFCNSIHTSDETIETDRGLNVGFSSETTKTINFSNPITKITLEGYIGTTTLGSHGTLKIVGENGETETITFDENCKNWTPKSTTINFNRATRKVTLTAKTDLTYSIFIRNIQFHQDQYFELDESDIEFGECKASTTYSVEKTISFSDIQNDIYFALKDGEQGFTVNTESIKTGCETSNSTSYTISFTPNVAGEYEDILTISTGNEIKEIKLSGKANLNDHQLAWNTDDFTATYGDNNIEFTPATDNANLSISYSSSNENVAKFVYNPETQKREIQIIGAGTATLTAEAGNGTTYIKKTATKQIIVNKADPNINWIVNSLTTVDRQVKVAESDKNIDILYEIVGNGAQVTDNGTTISVTEISTFKVKAYNSGNENYNAISDEKEFTSTIGTIRFDNNAGDKHWSNPNNWVPVSELNKQRNVEPSAMVNAVITAEAEISNDTNTVCDEINDLTIEANGKLTITATSALKANKVTNTVAENLILKASDKGNATLIYADGEPKATVEMYSKAENGTLDHTDGKDPQWQYVGVAVDGTTTSAFSNAWLLKWEEKDNVTGDPWTDAPLANTDLAPWAGYSISQPKAATYLTTGSLMRGDHTYTLTRTESTDPDCGFNLLANSYTAPIDITKLTTDNFKNADACIILYNTGTYADWESQQGQSGQNPGQLTVIPVATSEATGLPTTIASMQAFFVKANENNASFTVDYETAVAGATNKGNQMRAPRAHEEFNVLKIMIEGENSRDRLFLLENEETTKAYDNGYEARKIFDAPRGHQMYATCEYGYASIDCSESFVGQTIGLKGDNEGEMLTISFDTDRLEGYQSLYLYDKVTGKYVNILSGEKYTFFGIKGANDNRFSIVTNPDDKAQTPPFVIIGNELAFDKSQIDADNANIYIYDTSGRLLMTDKINPHENYNIPNMPEGIYLINMNGYTTKIVRKKTSIKNNLIK